jgi:hypothetical protein
VASCASATLAFSPMLVGVRYASAGMASRDDSDAARPCQQATWSCPVCQGTMVTVERLSAAQIRGADLCVPFDTS